MKKMEFDDNLEENLNMDLLERQIIEQRKTCRKKAAFCLGLYAAIFLSFFAMLPLGMELLFVESLYTIFGGTFTYFVERSWSSGNRFQLEKLIAQKNDQQKKMTEFVKELRVISHLKLSPENLKNTTIAKQPSPLINSSINGIKLYSIPTSTKHSIRLLQAKVSTLSDWEEEHCFDTLWLEEKDSVESGIQYLSRKNQIKEDPWFDRVAMVHWDNTLTKRTVQKQLKKRKRVSLF